MAVQPAGLQAKGAGLSRAERKVVKVVNGIRASHGLRRLRASRALTRAAGAHTGDILRDQLLSHSSSDGTPMAARLRGYTGAAWVGENIAWVTLRRGVARAVVRMWMASPGHRAVLLLPRAAHRRWQADGPAWAARRSRSSPLTSPPGTDPPAAA